MPNNKPTIDEQISKLMERFDEVNDFYIEKIAKQILTIGEMNQSSINRVVIMAEMNANMAEISARLAKALKQSVQDLYKIYQQAMQEAYTDPRFARALTETPLSDAAKGRLRQYTRAVSLQTAGTMQNLSNTTASSAQYRQIVDKAVLAVSSGLDSYQTATREYDAYDRSHREEARLGRHVSFLADPAEYYRWSESDCTARIRYHGRGAGL